MSESFRALRLNKTDDGQSHEFVELTEADLMEGDVTVSVSHSTLNYKDGLALTGASPVVRVWPMVPGIDFAGTVESSDHADFKPGDEVILNGWGVGETHFGGYAGKARVKGDWLVKRPEAISAARAMAIGTAGYTAMLCVLAIEESTPTDAGEILVTGAAGGVGSVAIALLAKLGYQVVASTGRASEADYLTGLGASRIVSREEMLDDPGKPMESGVWGGCIDCVGGQILARAIKQMNYGCGIASLGNTAGAKMEASIIPFLLRGVAVLGIDSVMVPVAERQKIWAALDAGMPRDVVESMAEEIGLADVPEYGKKILEGKVRGRILVNVNN